MGIFEDEIVTVFIILFALILLACAAVALARYINKFSRELKYLNIEISRTQGAERRHFIRRRRRLWLSIIPFIKY